MSLKDGGGSSHQAHFLRKKGRWNSTAFSWDRGISGPPSLWAAIPSISHFWKTPSKRCVSQEISNHEMMMKMNHDTTLVVLGTHCSKPYKKIS